MTVTRRAADELQMERAAAGAITGPAGRVRPDPNGTRGSGQISAAPLGIPGRASLQARGEPLSIDIIGSRGFPSTYGGYETLVRHVAPSWAKKGHHVTVYGRTRLGGRRIWEIDGVRCIWTPGRDTKSASTLTFGLSSHLDAAARRFDAALVLNIANGYFLPILAARGIAITLNTDGLEWRRDKWGSNARKVFYRGACLSAKYADVLVSDSCAIADIWATEFGVRPRYIPYGAEVQRAPSHDRITALGFEPGSYVLAVARLIPENNVDLTLDALDHMAERRPAIVVGSANYPTDTESRLRELDRAGRVRWLGHVHDQQLLAQLWGHCGVYVHGHSVGGTNPALLQALGAGAPTLALNTPFNFEVIGHRDQLFAHDAVALGREIENVLANRAVQQCWATRGKRTVESRFQWQSVYDSYERALQDAVRSRAEHPAVRRVTSMCLTGGARRPRAS